MYPGIVTLCTIATPTVMVRRETLARKGLAFEESLTIGEDAILWIDVARNHEILGIDRALTRVRIHGRNAFSDPEAQYRGGIDILRHSFRKDARFGLVFRRRELAKVCWFAGHLFLGQGNEAGALRCFARGAAYWPADPRNLYFVLLLLLPHGVRRALRRIRNAMLGYP